MKPVGGEREIRTGDQILNGAGDKHVAWSCERRHSGTDVNGETADSVLGNLAFTGVETGAHLQAEQGGGLPDGAGAGDGPAGCSEGGEEAVACWLDLPALEAPEFSAHQGVMTLEDLPPPTVPQVGSPVRRSRDVGDKDGDENPVDRIRRAGSGEESLDLVEQRVEVTQVFDLPHVVAGATKVLAEAGVGGRAETAGGDFFTSVPG
jgi:hypothetical protein